MQMQDLNDLLTTELQDLYSGEQQMLAALPKMAEAASSPQLKEAFESHITETQEQAKQLEEVAVKLGIPIAGKECAGMQGIIQEGETTLQKTTDPATKDAALIASAQKAEHYEIAGYGSAKTYASILGKDDIAQILDTIAQQEGDTDKKLTQLAISSINQQAAS